MAKSFTQLKDQFKTLSLNATASNGTLAGILLNDIHRQLILKYFDNERSFQMATIGPQSLTLTTSTLAAGSTTATLTTAWPSTNVSCQQLAVFGDGEQRTVNFTQGSTTITWAPPTTTVQSSTGLSCVGVQSYPLPANISKIKNATITIGQLVYTPAPVSSIQEWTKLNALPYTAAYPAYFYIYNNQLQFWPIPSASGNVITLNCQINVPDMTYADYSTGTIATMVQGSNIVTGSSTSWNSSFPTNIDLTFSNLYLTATPPNGDGYLYQVQNFTSGTSATLFKPVVAAPNTAGSSYTIGQYPLLDSDFHDAILYGALRVYFASIVKDPDRYNLYNGLFSERLDLMKFYLATKSVNVDLSVSPTQQNPNLYIYSPS